MRWEAIVIRLEAALGEAADLRENDLPHSQPATSL